MNSRIVIASLTLSAAAFGGLVAYEGWCGSACIPVPGDVPTLGFGTTDGVRMGDTITPQKAVQRALQDVAKFEGAVKQCVRVPLHQYEYDAYISLSYNIGPTAFCGSTLVRKLNAADYATACREFEKWVMFKGKKLPGLVARRAKERATCEGGA